MRFNDESKANVYEARFERWSIDRYGENSIQPIDKASLCCVLEFLTNHSNDVTQGRVIPFALLVSYHIAIFDVRTKDDFAMQFDNGHVRNST